MLIIVVGCISFILIFIFLRFFAWIIHRIRHGVLHLVLLIDICRVRLHLILLIRFLLAWATAIVFISLFSYYIAILRRAIFFSFSISLWRFLCPISLAISLASKNFTTLIWCLTIRYCCIHIAILIIRISIVFIVIIFIGIFISFIVCTWSKAAAEKWFLFGLLLFIIFFLFLLSRNQWFFHFQFAPFISY